MQKALFLMDTLRVTQGPGVGSHAGSLAVDFGGTYDGGRGSVDKLYAPFDLVIKRVQNDSSHQLYFWSAEKVRWANGVEDYVTGVLMHTDTQTLKVGQVVRQGEYLYTEGTFYKGRKGGVVAHIHMELARGHVDPSQIQNAKGTYVLRGQVRVNDVLFVPDSVAVAATGGLAWARINDKEIEQTQEDEMQKIKIFPAKDVTPSSKLLQEGWILDAAGRMYNPKGEAVYAREYVDISPVFEDAKQQLAKYGEGHIMMAVEE